MPHFSDYSGTGSPGDGITPALLSSEPLATEGEATPGPDDYNPFDEMEDRQAMVRGTDAPEADLPDFGGADLTLPDFF